MEPQKFFSSVHAVTVFLLLGSRELGLKDLGGKFFITALTDLSRSPATLECEFCNDVPDHAAAPPSPCCSQDPLERMSAQHDLFVCNAFKMALCGLAALVTSNLRGTAMTQNLCPNTITKGPLQHDFALWQSG